MQNKSDRTSRAINIVDWKIRCTAYGGVTATCFLLTASFAHAQPVAPSSVTPALPSTTTTPGVTTPNVTTPTRAPTSSVLPTDITPVGIQQEKENFLENAQIRMLQFLPSNLFFTSTCETSLRYETNPFQFPTVRKLLKTQLPPPQILARLSQNQTQQILSFLDLASNNDAVFRVLPNVTVGWALTPRTRVYSNYFLLHDEFAQHSRLDTTIQSVGGGLQRDFTVGPKGNLQIDLQFRELYTSNQQPVFDFLPNATFTYVITPRTIGFVNGIFQMRGKRPFQPATREIDPFYSFGALYNKNGWTFSASAVLVQNFREPFGKNAIIRQDNYSWILDFEIARRISRALPGLQAFVRAEPIYNFQSNNTPGLSGMDFRLFGGMRMALAKRPLTSMIDDIRKDLLEEDEEAPPTKKTPPKNDPNQKKPSATLPLNIAADDAPEPQIDDMTAPTTSYQPPIQLVSTSKLTQVAHSNQPVREDVQNALWKALPERTNREATNREATNREATNREATEPAKPKERHQDKTVSKELPMFIVPPLPGVREDGKPVDPGLIKSLRPVQL